MPILWSQIHLPTSRSAPAAAITVSHRLLVRAGLFTPTGVGVFSVLPIGLRCVEKLTRLCSNELKATGFQPVDMPDPAPLELAARTLLKKAERLTERTGLFCMQPQRREIDKPRYGLLDTRESLVCRAFSAAPGRDSAAALSALRATVENVARRCGVRFIAADDECLVERGSAVALLAPLDPGPSLALRSERGDYAALRSCARTGARPWSLGGDPVAALETIDTPGASSVREAADLLGVAPAQVLKTLVLRTDARGPALASGVDPAWVVAVVRGDARVNLAKLESALRENFHVGLAAPGPAEEAATRETWPIGYVGPDAAMRKPEAVLAIDYDAAANDDWVAGANEPGKHVCHFHWFRECGDRLADLKKTIVADLRDARAGDPAPDGGGALVAQRGAVVARVVSFTIGRDAPVAAAEIDLTRLLAMVVENHFDERGIVWPVELAPAQLVVTPLGADAATHSQAERLCSRCEAGGIEVLLDDRDERAGVKFADADLVGFPLRCTLSPRGLAEGIVEIKRRDEEAPTRAAIDDAPGLIQAALDAMKAGGGADHVE